ncbi:MAG: hypothetical protein LBK94_11535 [Prevotellaceae bacterium]|jgi:uncharacterized protein YbjQ (UPF0145 family)|nr:hypothetical protein [Prevotellaceae bacterium]
MRLLGTMVIVFFSLTILSCATGSTIVTGTVRPAINPTEVKIYLEPPFQYEVIGIVESSSDVEFSSQSAQDRAINKLKKQAAKIGANGIILTNVATQPTGSAGFYSGGFFYADNEEKKVAQGRAIYVIKEKKEPE